MFVSPWAPCGWIETTRRQSPTIKQGLVLASPLGHNRAVAVDRRPGQLLVVAEEVVGDLVAWCLLLLGVVFGLGMVGAVELVTHWSGA